MIRRGAGIVLALLVAGLGQIAQAVDCQDRQVGRNQFTICEARANEDIRLFLRDEQGAILGRFAKIEDRMAARGLTLRFAMNAGMYHADRTPVGLYIQDRQQEMRLVPNAGPGNFGLLPNGVFCIRDTRADVIETLAFQANPPDCIHATQSGPMLVIGGALHPRFLVDSDSRYVRNGVGTSADGQRVVFAISRNPVTFHEFGSLFQQTLGLPNALYFDGKVSRLYAPALNRADVGFPLGPIVGIVAPSN